MLSFTFDKNDWIRGASITSQHNDGGFSPFRKAVNLEVAQAGTLYSQPLASNIAGSEVTSEIIAFTADPSFLGNDGYALDASGNFYTIDNSTPTKRQTDGVKSYVAGTSNLRKYKNKLYATSTTDIAELDGTNLGTIDNDWWTVTNSETALEGSYRHCIEVVEDTMYISDNYRIHTWDGATTVYAAMSLPTNYNITSMIVHTDGRHLLVFCSETANYSHTSRVRAKLFMVDTVNLEFVREIDIDSQVEGVINVGGVIYCTYGRNLGYFNGDGMTFLRQLPDEVTYTHNLANKEGILLVRHSNGLLAYGNLGLGNVFWYPWIANQVGTGTLTSIYYYGDNKVLVSSFSARLSIIDFDDVGDVGAIDSNQYSFPSKVWIRKIRIETEVMASGTYIDFYYVDKKDFSYLLTTMLYSTDGAINEKEVFCNILTDLFRLRIIFQSGTTKGVKKVIIYYEDAE